MKHWWTYEFLGALLIIMSVLVFTFPVKSYAGLIFYFAASFVASGIMRTMFAITNRHHLKYGGLYVLGGVLDLIIGLYLFARPGLAALALPYYVGFYLMMGSIAAIAEAIDLKKLGLKNHFELRFLGFIALILSVLILMNPALGVIVAITSTGLCFMAMGIYYIVLGSRIRKIEHDDHQPMMRERAA